MSVARLFEDFGHQVVSPVRGDLQSTDELEEQKLKSFETGYGAGWEDAIKAQSESARVVSESLQQTLLDVKFTREEAFQAYVAAMRPLFEQIVLKVLPKLADQALLHNIVALLEQSLTTSAELPIEIRVAPEHQVTVANLLDGSLPDGASVLADSEVEPSQAAVTLGDSETQIDVDGLIDDIRTAISEFHISVQEGA